jgi:GTP cyclohydrolase IA
VTKDPTSNRRAKPPAMSLEHRHAVDGRRIAQPSADEGWDLDPAAVSAEYASMVARQLALLGEDPAREGLVKTPTRVANAMAWLTRGYSESVEDVVGDALFAEEHRNMVMVRDIELYSLCEHHMLPFFGKAHVAYIPNGRIVGLSKLPRIVEVFARRLQVQERLTEEIAGAIEQVLEPTGVGVVIEAYHLCMMMRGVEKQNSKTITSAVRGSFRDDARTRTEFLYLAHGSQLFAP